MSSIDLEKVDDGVCHGWQESGRKVEVLHQKPHFLISGCNLSPMLFNLFINDLIEHLQGGMTEAVKMNGYSCNCLMYADDVLLLSETQALHGLGPKCKLIKIHEWIKKSTNKYVTLLPLENGTNLNAKG